MFSSNFSNPSAQAVVQTIDIVDMVPRAHEVHAGGAEAQLQSASDMSRCAVDRDSHVRKR